MAAMLALVWFLILMLMKTDAVSAEIITARSGEAVLLTFDRSVLKQEHIEDVRWTHPLLMVSLKNNMTCHHGRCSMLPNGSLSFSRVQPADSGNYSVNVFNDKGQLLSKTDLLLRVEPDTVCLSAACLSADTSRSSSVLVQVLICCFLVLLFFVIVILFMLRRRRNKRTRTADPLQENVYVVMHGHHGNKKKNEKKTEIEEECYVPCNPVPMETPITQQTSVDEEDIYV